MLDKTLAIILAGGVGSRLHPLTADRAKPAVPFGGNYRIIDFTLTNCLHSGLRRVLVLTQYKSHSLQKHLRDGWAIFNPEISEYITPVPPQMRTGESWYTGTADAIRQNLYLLDRSNASHVLILSGDHIYRMDYAAMLQFHRDQKAELTIACMPVPLASASSFGIMSVNDAHRIREFHEKPKNPRPLPNEPHRALASMGIYIFNMDLLCHALQADSGFTTSSHDFGKDIIPRLIETHCVCAYRFGGETGRVTPDRYWRDVGTIDSYYMANMDLLAQVPPLNLYQPDWPIRTYHGQNPPARMAPGPLGQEGQLVNSLLGSGTVVSGGTVRHSILFPQVQVDENAVVEDSILFDGVHVGAGAHLKRCIVDKNVQIPPGERIGFDSTADAARFAVSESSITVVPKGYRFLTNALHSLVGRVTALSLPDITTLDERTMGGVNRKAVAIFDFGNHLVPLAYQPLCKKNPGIGLGYCIKRLAIPYFRMANCHTIIGAKRFHFRVRDGVGWFTLAMVTKQTGIVDGFDAIDCHSGNYPIYFFILFLRYSRLKPLLHNTLRLITVLEICNNSGAFSTSKRRRKLWLIAVFQPLSATFCRLRQPLLTPN